MASSSQELKELTRRPQPRVLLDIELERRFFEEFVPNAIHPTTGEPLQIYQRALSDIKEKQLKEFVREGYTKIAEQGNFCCSSVNPCCGGIDVARNNSKKIGYTEEELKFLKGRI